MYEEIAELIFNYSIKNKYADEHFIRKIIDIIVNERKLTDYISKISVLLPDSLEKNYSGSHYGIETKELCIDRSNRLQTIMPFNYNVLLYNSKLVITILHELDHTKMNKEITLNTDNAIDIALTKIANDAIHKVELCISDEEYKNLSKAEIRKMIYSFLKDSLSVIHSMSIYHRNHDLAPFERRANIISMLNFSDIINILNETSLSKRNLDLVNLTLLRTLIKKSKAGYKVYNDEITNSPSYDYISKLRKKAELYNIDVYDENRYKAYINAKGKYSLNERILYGLPLSKEEYHELNEKSNPFNAFVLEKRKKI